MNKYDFILAGVGGQGTILLGDLIGEAGIAAGYDVKKSDVLGMSQRGGNVVSYVRMAEKIYAPLPKKGDVDFVVSLEVMEASRWVQHLRPGGTAIVNHHRIFPLSVSSGFESYPSNEKVESLLRSKTDRVFFVEGTAIAGELRNPRVVNVVVLGFLSTMLPIEESIWKSVVAKRVPPGYIDLNLDAFERGKAEAVAAFSKPAKQVELG